MAEGYEEDIESEIGMELEAMIDGTHEEMYEQVDDEGADSGSDDGAEDFEDTDQDGVDEIDPDYDDDDYDDKDYEDDVVADSDDEDDYDDDDDEDGEAYDDDEENSQDDEEDDDDFDDDYDEDYDDDYDDDESGEDEPEESITREEYEKLKSFHDNLTQAEFVANGKKVKGMTSVEDLIRAQQLSLGFNKKMEAFNKFRPIMSAIKDNGLLEDKDKFNLMMQVMNGDKEALKTHIKNLGIDPTEDLDPEDGINYEAQDFTENSMSIAYKDMMSEVVPEAQATVSKIVSEEWDDSSINKLMSDAPLRNSFIDEINSGRFDAVQEVMQRMEVTDRTGEFNSLSSIEKYNEAADVWNRVNIPGYAEKADMNYKDAVLDQMLDAGGNQATNHNNYTQQQGQRPEGRRSDGRRPEGQRSEVDRAKVDAEKANIQKIRELEEYKAKVEAREAKARKSRSRAANVSKKRAPAAPKMSEEERMEEMDGQELSDYLTRLIESD